MESFEPHGVPASAEAERFRTEQEKTEETEAPKAPVTFGGSPFSECSRILKKVVLFHFHASVLSVISCSTAWIRLQPVLRGNFFHNFLFLHVPLILALVRFAHE
jgi:hypothetical protein